jgi:hypothetical protein
VLGQRKDGSDEFRSEIGKKQLQNSPFWSQKQRFYVPKKRKKRPISTHNVAFRDTAFDHREAVPAVVVLDLVHYVVDEQNAAAAGLK